MGICIFILQLIDIFLKCSCYTIIFTCVQYSDPQVFKGHTPFIVIIKYLLYLTLFFRAVLGLQKNGAESRESFHTPSSRCIPWPSFSYY